MAMAFAAFVAGGEINKAHAESTHEGKTPHAVVESTKIAHGADHQGLKGEVTVEVGADTHGQISLALGPEGVYHGKSRYGKYDIHLALDVLAKFSSRPEINGAIGAGFFASLEKDFDWLKLGPAMTGGALWRDKRGLEIEIGGGLVARLPLLPKYPTVGLLLSAMAERKSEAAGSIWVPSGLLAVQVGLH